MVFKRLLQQNKLTFSLVTAAENLLQLSIKYHRKDFGFSVATTAENFACNMCILQPCCTGIGASRCTTAADNFFFAVVARKLAIYWLWSDKLALLLAKLVN
jgi:hypothetical protein